MKKEYVLKLKNDFNFLDNINQILNYDEFEGEIEKHSKLTSTEMWDAMQMGIDPAQIAQEKLDNHINLLHAQRKREREFLLNGNKPESAPYFNKLLIEIPEEFDKTVAFVKFHVGIVEPVITKWKRTNYWIPNDKTLAPAERVRQCIENAGQRAKNVVILMDDYQTFKSLDLLVQYHRTLNKLLRFKRRVYIVNKKNKVKRVTRPGQIFKPSPIMTLENPKIVASMGHYINLDTEVNMISENLPSKGAFGGYIPFEKKPQLPLEVGEYYRGAKVVAKRNADEIPYKLNVTYNKYACQCRLCQHKKKCPMVQKEQVTAHVDNHYHAKEYQELLAFRDLVTSEFNRLMTPESDPSIDSQDMYIILNTFGYSSYDIPRHEQEQLFKSILSTKPDLDFIDFEQIAKQDLNNHKYEIYDKYERANIVALRKYFGDDFASLVYETLNEWKEQHNDTEYYGNVEVFSSVLYENYN